MKKLYFLLLLVIFIFGCQPQQQVKEFNEELFWANIAKLQQEQQESKIPTVYISPDLHEQYLERRSRRRKERQHRELIDELQSIQDEMNYMKHQLTQMEWNSWMNEHKGW